VAGRTHRAKLGEPTCGARLGTRTEKRCARPAGLGTATPGIGPCLRHGGEPPKVGDPINVIARELNLSRKAGVRFDQAWEFALTSAIDPDRDWDELRRRGQQAFESAA